MQTSIFNLAHLGLIEIAGPDAEQFLQGQLTCDARKANKQLHTQPGQLGAHCDHKGRIQAIFHLFHYQKNYYYLLLSKSLIPHLLQCLQKYAVFSKITLEDISEQITNKTQILQQFEPQQLLNENAWRLSNIYAGIPTIYPETIGEFTPHQVNLHLINGISFNKGCYTGQEVIARMHYLGKLKQKMYRVSFIAKQTPSPGTKIYNANNQEIGIIVISACVTENHQQALAVLQNNQIEEKIHLATQNDVILTVLGLPYTSATLAGNTKEEQ